ncbi:MAG: exodeoxyribonuclease V subunit beta [Chromatiales bacterium]|nr:exodeoxyribonuclease V subunit beta [Chromatiales bacterium]
MSTHLDPLTLPLDGLRLIEASAGTGKTFTIANLYLRQLLSTAHPVTALLVVTFTNAATAELRERIRARLVAALATLEGDGREDKFLAALIREDDAPPPVADIPTRPTRSAARLRLRDALTRMDEAAIFTIHGFCQRVLADAAFESGAWFDAELGDNQGELLTEAVRDFWRQHFYPADAALAAWVKRTWDDPDGLRHALTPLFQQPRVRVVPADASRVLDAAEADYANVLGRFLIEWRQAHEAVAAIVYAEKTRLSQSQQNYCPERLDPLFIALHRFADARGPLPANFDLLTRTRFDAAIGSRGQPVGDHPIFDLGQHVQDAADALDRARRAYWLGLAHAEVSAALARRKRELGLLGFEDLLSQLADALADPDPDHGAALAARIRLRFPVAMIDEFQDTDPLQYAIFSRVYLAPDATDTALYLIGDPKQAIYAFRGADVFTYMQARDHVTGLVDADRRMFSLATNWRSTKALIDALNALFKRGDRPFHYTQIPYEPVGAGGNADRAPLTIDGERPTPLAGWLLDSEVGSKGPKAWTRGAATRELARLTAAEIAQLLNLAELGKAVIGQRRLTPADCAVLVRSHREADQVRAALRAAGVASVYLSRDSVFETPEAASLQQLLLAVSQPWDRNAVRVALGGELVGLDAPALLALDADERAWEGHVETLHALHRRWRDAGFFAMFLTLLDHLKVTGQALARADGERRLTNLLQIAELMQVASAEHPGMLDLLGWLGAQRQSADGNNEAQQLRLESDAERVRIVTIHKSKGLQYPLVFLPFVGFGPSARRGEPDVLLYHDADNTLIADLGSDQRDTHRAIRRTEELAEDMRLLYVALTRAQQRCYLGWGRLPDFADGALRHLLMPAASEADDLANDLADEAIHAALRDLAIDGTPAFEARPDETHRLRTGTAPEADASARVFSGELDDDWRVSSFTALAQSAEAPPGADTTERPDHDQIDAASQASGRGTDAAPPGRTRFAFPRGAHAGVLLHGVLEKLDFSAADATALTATLTQRLPLQGFDADWAAALADWLLDALAAPFGGGLRLRDLPRARRLDEMEFHYPLARLTPDALNGLFAADLDTPALSFSPRRGLMKGYIDLVFEHGGRFHLADYKSNHLGDDAAAYNQTALGEAMRAHRYDLQALIYAVALHRYLRLRVPGYRYDTHFGGIHYLFLRGMSASHPDGHGVVTLRPDLALIERLDHLFAEGTP